MEAPAGTAQRPVMTRTLKGVLIALGAYAIIPLGDTFLKMATQHHTLLYAASIIDMIQITLLMAIAPFFGGHKKLWQTQNRKRHLMRGALMTALYLLFIYAITHMEIARTYAFYLTQPFFLCIMAHFMLGERIGKYRVLALMCGFCGVLIMLRPGFAGISLPVLAAILCAALFAFSNILIKTMAHADHWLSFVFYMLIVQAPFIILTYTLTSPAPFAEFRWDTLPYMAATAAAYTTCTAMFATALRHIDASLFGGLEYTALIWATLFGFFLFSEVPDSWTIAGSLVIVASGIYLVYRERKAHLAQRKEF